CALRWQAIDLDAGVVTIRRALYRAGAERGEKVTKSRRERDVAIPLRAVDRLRTWRAHCETRAAEAGVELAPDAFVVPSYPDGTRPTDPDKLTRYVRNLSDRLGLPKMHAHAIRHFVATEVLAASNARDAADMLGHASPAFTLQR